MNREKAKTMKKKRRRIKKKIKRGIIISTFLLVCVLFITTTIFMKRVTVVIDGKKTVKYTFAKDYKSLFEKMGIEIKRDDKVSLEVNSLISRGSVVEIDKAQLVTIEVDGKVLSENTTKDTFGEVLSELGVEINSSDILSRDVNEKIVDGDKLVITRVTKNKEIVSEDIPFGEKSVQDYKTNVGETRVISDGVTGIRNITYDVLYENGVEVKRDKLGEEIAKEPQEAVVGKGIFDPNSLTVCVNRRRYISEDYVPELVVPNVRSAVSTSRIMLRPEAATALENLFNAAEDEGIYLYAVSGYRSYYYQASIYNPYSGYSAPPGASEHQLGLAMDVNTSYYGSSLVTDFAYTPEGIWVSENAHKYGFVIRYMSGKEDITGYNYEPWHIRYLGTDLATELYNKGITLEEYYGEY